MKSQKLPKDGNILEVIETFQEIAWRKIALGVKGFIADLKGRGLQGKNLKLIITDGNPALLKAIK